MNLATYQLFDNHVAEEGINLALYQPVNKQVAEVDWILFFFSFM